MRKRKSEPEDDGDDGDDVDDEAEPCSKRIKLSTNQRPVWRVFEDTMVRAHQARHPTAVVWHWDNIPSDALMDAGYFTSASLYREEQRQRRLHTYRRPEFGLDGMARLYEHDVSQRPLYHGLQAKCYTAPLQVGDIGTTLMVAECLQQRDPRNATFIYHTSALARHIAEDVAFFTRKNVYFCAQQLQYPPPQTPTLQPVDYSNAARDAAVILKPEQLDALLAVSTTTRCMIEVEI